MRAARSTAEGIAVVEAETPVPRSDQVLVSVERAGICGSDLHMISEGFVGVTLGHEFAGRLEDGALAAIRPTGACGSCAMCAVGRINLCASAFGAFHGGVIDGGWADVVAVDASTVHRVPEAVSAASAALVEPLAVAVHAARRTGIAPGQTVAVVGGGSVGLATAAALLHAGHDVDIEARYHHQRRAAEHLGAKVGLEGQYDVVFDAVGTQSAVDTSLRACKSGGAIVELGVFWEPIHLTRELTLREITLVPALFYAHDHSTSDFDEAIRIVTDRPEIETILVTHTFPLDDVAEALRVAGDRSAGAIKVQLAVRS